MSTAGIQNNVTVDVAYAPEPSIGTPAAQNAATSKIIRRVSTTLGLGKDIFQSAEVRTDQQLADMRHGTQRPAGSIDGEISTGSYDDWIEALLRGTWVAGTSASQTDFTSLTTDGTTAAFTFAGGDPIAKGFRIGDVVRTTGTVAAVDNDNFRITGFSGTSNRIVGVDHIPAAAIAADTAFTFGLPGKKLQNGILRRSFTLEQRYNDIGGSERFRGMRVGSGQFRVPPNGMATCSWAFMGVGADIYDSVTTTPLFPYFTAPAPQGSTRVLAGPSGSIRFAGSERSIVTSFDLTIDDQMSADPVVGSNFLPEIYYGVMKVSGTVAIFLADMTLLRAFYQEQEVDLELVINSGQAGVVAPDFISFSMQRVKLGGATKSINAAGGVVLTCPYTALLPTASAGIDGATIQITRSNVT